MAWDAHDAEKVQSPGLLLFVLLQVFHYADLQPILCDLQTHRHGTLVHVDSSVEIHAIKIGSLKMMSYDA